MKSFYTFLASVALSTTTLMAAPPDSPTEFTMVFDLNGGNPVMRGTLTAPTTDRSYSNPAELTSIQRIYVVRSCYSLGESDEPVYTIMNPVPGQTYTFIDECEEPLEKGYEYSYVAKAVTDEGESYGAYCYGLYGIKPQSPSVTASTADQGNFPVTLSITAPTRDTKGNELSLPLTSLVIKRYISYTDEPELATIANPHAGQTYSWQMSEGETDQSYTFHVYAVCEWGTSEYGVSEIFVGVDVPDSPTGLTVTVEDDHVNLSWNAPTSGKNSGWFDPAATRYTVERTAAGQTTTLADDLVATSFTDMLEDLTHSCKIIYTVTATNATGIGGYTSSPEVIAGPAARLPFIETFNSQNESGWYVSYEADNIWTTEESGWYSDWTVTGYDYSSGFEGADATETVEDGFLKYNAYYSSGNDSEWYRSGDIQLNNAVYPVLSLQYAAMEYPSYLEVSLLEGENTHILLDFPVNEVLPGAGEKLWIKKIAPAEGLEGVASVAVQLRAYTPEYDGLDYSNVLIDNVAMDDYPYVTDVTVASEAAQTTLTWSAPGNGRFDADMYEITVDGGAPVETPETSYSFATNPGDEHTVGVRAKYGDIPSKIVPVSFTAGATDGVNSVMVDGIRTDYFTIDGLRVDKPAQGMLLIRRTVNANGAVATAKVRF